MDVKCRYHLFAGDQYYPNGGMDDFVSSHAHKSDAVAAGLTYVNATKWGVWAHVYDTVEACEVWVGYYQDDYKLVEKHA